MAGCTTKTEEACCPAWKAIDTTDNESRALLRPSDPRQNRLARRLREGSARLEKGRRGHARRVDTQDHARARDGRADTVRGGGYQVGGRSAHALQKGKSLSVLWMLTFRNAGSARAPRLLY